LALRYRYEVQFETPTTEWWLQRNIDQLVECNIHNTSRQMIEEMLLLWEDNISIDAVLMSRTPDIPVPYW